MRLDNVAYKWHMRYSSKFLRISKIANGYIFQKLRRFLNLETHLKDQYDWRYFSKIAKIPESRNSSKWDTYIFQKLRRFLNDYVLRRWSFLLLEVKRDTALKMKMKNEKVKRYISLHISKRNLIVFGTLNIKTHPRYIINFPKVWRILNLKTHPNRFDIICIKKHFVILKYI